VFIDCLRGQSPAVLHASIVRPVITEIASSLVNDTSTFNSNQLVVPQVKSQSADVELSLFIDHNTETSTYQIMHSSYVNRYEDRQFCHIKNVCCQTNLQQLWRQLQVRTPKLWNFQRFQRLV